MRQRLLQVLMVVIGLIFTAAIYPLVLFWKDEPTLAMMMSLYFTLGICLLLAARNPVANRSLIAFTAWSSFAHGGVMGYQAYHHVIPHHELIGVAVFLVVGIILIVLSQPRPAATPSA